MSTLKDRLRAARGGGAYRVARAGFERVANLLPAWDLPGVPGPVSRADVMMTPGRIRRPSAEHVTYYAEQGAAATVHLVRAVESVGRSAADVAAVLDLGCGHGRVLRHLPSAFPAATITGADTDASGAAFCARSFGAVGVAVRPEPSDVPAGPFDVIWMGSVLTHLDADAGRALLSALIARLTPTGVLAFSTLDPSRIWEFADARDRAADATPDGFLYVPYPHSTDASYGLAFAGAAHVRALVTELSAGSLSVAEHRPTSWSGQQDLWSFHS